MEQWCLTDLVERYAPAMLRAAAAILGDVSEAEDAVQDAFVRCLEKRPAFPDEARCRAWLLKVTANGCKSRLRARKRRPTQALTHDMPAPEPGDRAVAEAVMALPPTQRGAIHLYYYEGYSTDEIAAILGKRPGTVRAILTRARQALRETLKGDVTL